MSELFVRSSGPSDAPVIVLLHGGGVGGWMWRAVMEQLPQYRCLAPDLPEQGQSQHVKPFSIEFAADQVAELIREQVPGGKAHVVGLSAGAQVTVALLSRNPQVVNRAVVSSALVRPLPGLSGMGRWIYRWSYYAGMAGPLKQWDWWIRLNMHYSAGIPDRCFADFKTDFQRITPDGLANVLYSSMNFRIPTGLDRVTAPVLVVAGEKEYRQMRDSARDLAQAMPHAVGRLHSLGAVSKLAQEHNWAVTAPELFAQTVEIWVEGRELPGFLREM